MDRRGFIRTAAGAFFARFIPKPAPMPSVVPKMPEANLTVHYNCVFMKWLYENLEHIPTVDPRLPTPSDRTVIFRMHPLGTEKDG